MDWTVPGFAFSENDFKLFQYDERETTVIQRHATDNVININKMTTAKDWQIWLDNNESLEPRHLEAGICVILCSRAKSISEEEPSPVAYLPFTRRTFETITKKFRVHRTMSRTVAREAAYFSCTTVVEPGQEDLSIVFTCRMNSAWPDDLAMSVTFFPESSFTLAMVFGCNERQRRQFEGRLAMASPAALTHPLLFPGIFAELERKRLSERVEDTLDRFTLRTSSASDSSNENRVVLNMSEQQMGEYLQLCYQSQSLAKEFKSVKRQLAKMVQFCDTFGAVKTNPGRYSGDSQATLVDAEREEALDMNDKIKKRTLEIMDEYDDKVDECDMVLQNMTVTMQTVWSQIARRDAVVNTSIARANISIALDTKQDNGQMKSIAFLTMIYLPVSAVASIFSMTMFNWSPKDGSPVSNYIWVFVVVAAVLTGLTLVVWQIAIYMQKKKAPGYEDLEMRYSELSTS